MRLVLINFFIFYSRNNYASSVTKLPSSKCKTDCFIPIVTMSKLPVVNPGCPMVARELALVLASIVTTVIRSLPKTWAGESHETLMVKLVPAAAVAETTKLAALPLAFLKGAIAARVFYMTPTAAL